MIEVRFRFYAELNDFLPLARRGCEFRVASAPTATAKHAIEALGVPHSEVELIVIDGQAVAFTHRLRDGERLAVYPHFTQLGVDASMCVAPRSGGALRFVADAHLGALAKQLRMAGFDTLYRNDYADREIAHIAQQQQRVVLTRDRDLLKQRAVAAGALVRAIRPAQQFAEVVRRFALAAAMRPFTRCLCCNTALVAVDGAAVGERVPPSVRQRRLELAMCPDCRRVFWRGTHWQRMRALLDAAAAEVGSGGAAS